MKKLEGRVAAVTGAGSGIGRAVSVLLAKRGCALALSDIDAAGLEETAKRTREAGANTTTRVVDVADRSAMEQWAARVVEDHGAVHILINNAGVSVTATMEEQSIEDYEWIIGINLWGVIYGCKFFLPYLRQQDEGHIVNLSSMFGLIGLPSQGSYNITKFGVRGLSESLRAELAGTGIGVTSVHPGGIDTNIVRASRMSDESNREGLAAQFKRFGMSPERAAEKIVRGIERDMPRVRICRETYVTDWLVRLAPVTTHRLLGFFAKRGLIQL